MMMRTSCAALILGATMWTATASAAETAAERLDRLQAGTESLARRMGAEDVLLAQATVPSSVAGDFEVRLQRLEQTLSDLTGRVEENGHQLSQLQDKLDRMSGDYEFRFQELEKGTGGKPGMPPTVGGAANAPAAGNLAAPKPGIKQPDKPTPPTAPTANPPAAGGAAPAMTGDAQADYDRAFALLGKEDLAGAEKAFQAFIAKYGKNPLAGNAQYWLGETYYGRKKFPEAVAAFGDAFKGFPTGSKAPDSLLKLGMSFSQLGKKKEACTAYSQLLERFPNAAPSVRKLADAEIRKQSCGK
jgi:tol-pal system protein YbgF